MITVDLLKKVLKNDTIHTIDIDENNVYYYGNVPNEGDFINIYELVYKCKEWAFENIKRSISSEYNKNGFSKKKSWKIGIRFGNCPEYFIADSEAEGIFDACQWILKYNKEI